MHLIVQCICNCCECYIKFTLDFFTLQYLSNCSDTQLQKLTKIVIMLERSVTRF